MIGIRLLRHTQCNQAGSQQFGDVADLAAAGVAFPSPRPNTSRPSCGRRNHEQPAAPAPQLHRTAASVTFLG